MRIGRWGDGRSPAFGDLSDSHFVGFAFGSKADRRAMWGEVLLSPEDVYDVFAQYIEGKVRSRQSHFHSSSPAMAAAVHLAASNLTALLLFFFNTACGI